MKTRKKVIMTALAGFAMAFTIWRTILVPAPIPHPDIPPFLPPPSVIKSNPQRPQMTGRSTKPSTLQNREAAIAPSPSMPLPMPDTTPDAIAGEYVLTFFNARDRQAFEAWASQFGIRIMDRLPATHAVRITLRDQTLLARLLREAPTPVSLQPNIFVQLPPPPSAPPAQAPSTPYTGFGNRVLDWLGVSSPDPAWGNGLRIAVLDTGIPETADTTIFSRLDLTVEGYGQNLHAGAVAALITGASGIVPSSELIDIKVLSDNGSGDAFTLARGIIEAVDRGASVINISAGTRGESEVLRTAINYAQERGVMLVAAAGNDGVDQINYPAAYDGVVAVGGVDANGLHVYFSNTGEALDLSAPGIGITLPGLAADQSEITFSGTSAAAPLVTAAAALLRSQNPGLTPEATLALLQQYSNDTAEPGRDAITGAGILDLGRLLNRDVPDIVDLTTIQPYIRPDGDRILLDIFGQNRGTTALTDVAMDITLNGITQTQYFSDVTVGSTVLHTLALPTAQFEADGVDIAFVLRPIGASDRTPQDNAYRAILRVNWD